MGTQIVCNNIIRTKTQLTFDINRSYDRYKYNLHRRNFPGHSCFWVRPPFMFAQKIDCIRSASDSVNMYMLFGMFS